MFIFSVTKSDLANDNALEVVLVISNGDVVMNVLLALVVVMKSFFFDWNANITFLFFDANVLRFNAFQPPHSIF